MKYYIVINGQQLGPMEPREATQYGLTPETLVWTEGMADWAPAGQIAEFAPFLTTQQPYAPGGYPHPNAPIGLAAPQCPSTHLAMAILVTLLCCMPIGIVSIIYASKVESAFYSGNYFQAQQNSNKAKNWAIAAIFAGAAVVLLYTIFYIVGIAALANIN